MRLAYNYWWRLLYICLLEVCCVANAAALKQMASTVIVRVLLDELSDNSNIWHLKASDGFLISDLAKKNKQFLMLPEVTIQYHQGYLYIQGKRIADQGLRVIALKGNIAFQGKNYPGMFEIVLHDHGLYCINYVELENYVCSVLRTEGWPGWPCEFYKVLAIASRSYAVAMMRKARKQTKHYDVRNTNAHQTYSGVHEIETIKKAVEQTRGLILVHNNEPIIAMFDACCGGIIPAHVSYFNFRKAPYLAREYACKHCKKCRIFSWKAELDHAQMCDRIAPVFNTHRLHEVVITKKDKAGLIEELHLKGAENKIAVSGKKFYSLFKEIKSFCYKVCRKKNKFLINGWGYGHHIGLCQWGAREMVREGWHHKRILAFYYPHTDLRKLGL